MFMLAMFVDTQVAADISHPTQFRDVYATQSAKMNGLYATSQLELGATIDSTSTGTAQTVTLFTPATTFTNAGLVSIRNFGATSVFSKSPVVIIKNNKSSGNITLINNSGGFSTQRILTGSGADMDILPGSGVILFYDTSASRWQVIGGSGGVTGPASSTDSALVLWDGTAGNKVKNSSVTIPITIANGGTGQVTKAPAFDALSPTVTKGDIPVYGASANVSVSVGANDRVLTADSTQTAGVQWSETLARGTGRNEYCKRCTAEAGTSGWATYADAAAITPVDGTGGSPTATWTATSTNGEVLRELQSFKLAKDAANRQGNGASYDFTLDPQDYNVSTRVYLSFPYLTSANFAGGDVQIFVYDKTGTTLLGVNDVNNLSGALQAASSKGTFTGWFDSVAGHKDYRLILHIATTNATAYNVFSDNVHIGGIDQVPSTITTAAKLYTPSVTTASGAISNATVTGSWWRNGQWLFARGQIAFTGTSSNFGDINGITLPTGMVIDTVPLVNATFANIGQSWMVNAASSASSLGVVGFFTSTTAVRITYQTGSAPVADSTYSQAAPYAATSGAKIQWTFMVPIVGWDAGVALSSADLMFDLLHAEYVNGVAATFSATAPFDFSTKVDDPFNTVTTGVAWKFTSPKKAKYHVCIAGSGRASGTGNTTSIFVNGSIAKSLFSYYVAGNNVGGCTNVDLNKGEYFDTRPDASLSLSPGRITIDEIPAAWNVPGFINPPTTQFLTAGTTYTTPPNVRYLKITMVGGGGGGGGVKLASGSKGAGGGGSGGACMAFITNPPATVTYAIGGSGAGGSNLGAGGSAGGNTTFTANGIVYTAGGGNGGGGSTGSEVNGGGAPGLGSNCTVNGYGGYGGVGLGTSLGLGAQGGTPLVPFGGYSIAVGGSTAGGTATNYGAGGGGATAANTTGQIGGAGSQGAILVEEYY